MDWVLAWEMADRVNEEDVRFVRVVRAARWWKGRGSGVEANALKERGVGVRIVHGAQTGK